MTIRDDSRFPKKVRSLFLIFLPRIFLPVLPVPQFYPLTGKNPAAQTRASRYTKLYRWENLGSIFSPSMSNDQHIVSPLAVHRDCPRCGKPVPPVDLVTECPHCGYEIRNPRPVPLAETI